MAFDRRAYWREYQALRRTARLPVTKWKSTGAPRATHIAGYVPPKGSVALMFHGRIVNPVRGLGL